MYFFACNPFVYTGGQYVCSELVNTWNGRWIIGPTPSSWSALCFSMTFIQLLFPVNRIWCFSIHLKKFNLFFGSLMFECSNGYKRIEEHEMQSYRSKNESTIRNIVVHKVQVGLKRSFYLSSTNKVWSGIKFVVYKAFQIFANHRIQKCNLNYWLYFNRTISFSWY